MPVTFVFEVTEYRLSFHDAHRNQLRVNESDVRASVNRGDLNRERAGPTPFANT